MVNRMLSVAALGTLGSLSGCFITKADYNGWFYGTGLLDTAFSDGSDGGTEEDGSDGQSGPQFVNGTHAVQIWETPFIGSWDITGLTNSCSDCLFEFAGDFTVQDNSDFGEDFSATVTWTTDYYVYGFNGDYWGYGYGDGSGYAYWAGYSTNGNYEYAGYVYY